MVLVTQQHQLHRGGRGSGQRFDGLHPMRDTFLNRALIVLAGMIGGAVLAAMALGQ
jgi:hypothetical protein